MLKVIDGPWMKPTYQGSTLEFPDIYFIYNMLA